MNRKPRGYKNLCASEAIYVPKEKEPEGSPMDYVMTDVTTYDTTYDTTNTKDKGSVQKTRPTVKVVTNGMEKLKINESNN